MSRKNTPFRFKKFSVSHNRSAMKVGVDGVLIGCWTEIGDARKVLDVGTGCGLIALIIAQRNADAEILAVDIDAPSVEEASENVAASPWADRIVVAQYNFSDLPAKLKDDYCRFDLIVSNPPYFDSGISEAVTPREKARHQGLLSPAVILVGALSILNPGGKVAMVVPADLSDGLEVLSLSLGYRLERKCLVRGHAGAPFKRALLQWIFPRNECDGKCEAFKTEYLTLEEYPGLPTEEYRSLCRDFYLKF